MTPEIFAGLPYHYRVKKRHKMGIRNLESEAHHDLDKLLNLICEYLELDKGKMIAKGRLRKYVTGRIYFCYISRLLTDEPLIKIGRLINRDHATVLHGIKKVNDLLSYDKETKRDIENLHKLYTNE